ncbi:serine/threonine-protein phosphatase 6 regulatory ankyrin repeat subunit B, partial [Hyalella azteca]|uniref:Serine/threonine-protein phosphatase 6 regulatory ankyrin repeat subunit B n=1 Tax=Hyalella azteca TaxID=294128 RepID=A0A8B7N8L2_HYAAZ
MSRRREASGVTNVSPPYQAIQMEELPPHASGADDVGTPSVSSQSPMAQAIEESDAKSLQEILSDGASHDDEIREQLLLHKAVLKEGKGSLEVLKLLLHHATEQTLFAWNENSRTVLHVTVKNASDEFSKLIIEKKNALLAATDGHGNTPLHYMVKHDRTKLCAMVQAYLTPEVINRSNNVSLTAIHVAAIEGSPNIMKILLKRGGDPMVLTAAKYTPLHLAAHHKAEQCVEHLLKAVQKMNNSQAGNHDSTIEFKNMRTSKGRTALMLAAKLGYLGICKKLEGTDVNMRCSDGKTALHYAASRGIERVISYLVEKLRADCSITDNQGFVPLVSSAAHDPEGFAYMLKITPENLLNEEVIKELIDQAAKKSLKNLEIMANRAEFRKHLEAYRDKSQNSLLHIAISNGSFLSAKALMESTNLSKTETNKDGDTPLHLLATKKVAKSASQEEERRIVRNELLRSAKEIVNSPNEKGETPLYLASKFGVQDVLCFILQNKPDVLKCTKQNTNAVYIAARHGHDECLRLLLRNLGPNGFSELRKMERHPLHLSSRHGHLECSKLLLTNSLGDENSLKNLRCYFKDKTGRVHYPVDEAFHGRQGELFRFLLHQMEIDKNDDLCVRLHRYFKQCLNEAEITDENQAAKNSASEQMTDKDSASKKQTAKDSASKEMADEGSASKMQTAKDLALRKQAAKNSALEREVAKKSSFKKAVLEAVIESPWCTVAFDGQFCNNIRQLVSSSSQEEVSEEVKPCDSFALLITKHPDLACRAMDRHITPLDGNRALHDYTPFECFYFRIEENRVLSPFTDIIPDNLATGQGDHEELPVSSIYRTVRQLRAQMSCTAAPNKQNQLEKDAKESSNTRWSRDHPLLKAVGNCQEYDRRVLCHRLTISWLMNKLRYAQWFLYGYLALDVLTAIIVTCLLSFTWESQHLQRTFSGVTRLQVMQAYDDTRSPAGDTLAAAEAVKLMANTDSHCSSWGNASWDSAGAMEVSSAAWNRSVCAVHHLRKHTPSVVTLEVFTIILLIGHVLIEFKLLARVCCAAVSKCFSSSFSLCLSGTTSTLPENVDLVGRLLRLVALGLLVLALGVLALAPIPCDFVLGCRQFIVWQLEVLAVLL